MQQQRAHIQTPFLQKNQKCKTVRQRVQQPATMPCIKRVTKKKLHFSGDDVPNTRRMANGAGGRNSASNRRNERLSNCAPHDFFLLLTVFVHFFPTKAPHYVPQPAAALSHTAPHPRLCSLVCATNEFPAFCYYYYYSHYLASSYRFLVVVVVGTACNMA